MCVLDQEDLCAEVVFCPVKIESQVWVCRLERIGLGEGVGPVGNGAVDSRHGTRVEGSLHPCTEGHHPK